MWHELPLPNEIYDYERFLTPDYLLKTEDELKQEDMEINSLNITL